MQELRTMSDHLKIGAHASNLLAYTLPLDISAG
jgi:hypothetical protein